MGDASFSLKVDYVHLCDHALVDTEGKVALIGIFDELDVDALPAVQPIMTVAIGLSGTPGHIVPVKVSLRPPFGGTEIAGSHKAQIVPMGPRGKAFCSFRLHGTTFDARGEYELKVTSAAETLALHVLRIRQSQHPESPVRGDR